MYNSKILLPAVLGLAMFSCSEDGINNASLQSASMQKLPVDVKVANSKPILHQEVIVGTIHPIKEVTITSELARKIVAIGFKDGSDVEEGQLLYKLDDSDLQAQWRKIQAELRLAMLNEKRASQLLKSEAVKQEEHDVALARLEALQAEEENLKVSIYKTEIKAPFSGKIGINNFHIGALVSPNVPLVQLQDQNKVKVSFKVPERYVALIQNGGEVEFSTEATSRKNGAVHMKFPAVINAIEATIDDMDRSILVQAVASNNLHLFKPGQTAKVFVSLSSKDAQAITLPTEAVIPTPQGYNVFVVKNGAVRAASVKVGNRTETDAIILDGIADGDTVMISNILRAGEGTPVEIASIQ